MREMADSAGAGARDAAETKESQYCAFLRGEIARLEAELMIEQTKIDDTWQSCDNIGFGSGLSYDCSP